MAYEGRDISALEAGVSAALGLVRTFQATAQFGEPAVLGIV